MILTGRDIQWYIETGKLVIDPVEPDQFQQNGVDLILEDIEGRPTQFWRGFYLGGTRETLKMPDDLMGFVCLRSTWARSGLLVPPTVVDAGFEGNLTLEILSAVDTLPVPYGQRFAHLILAKLSGPAEPYAGKYQGQRGITDARPD